MIYSCNAVQKSWKCFNHLVKIPVVRHQKHRMNCLNFFCSSPVKNAISVKPADDSQGGWKTTEVQVPMPYGHLAVKVWGSSGTPVLAIHGWQDNCGSFDRLIPLLPKSFQFFTLDLPGHGLSSHRPAGCFYTFLSMILEIKRVFEYFHWDKINIIGHSMGGQMSLLWSSIHPNTVNKLILLDAIKPFSIPMKDLPQTYETSIEKNLLIEQKIATGAVPIYTPKSAVERYVKGVHGELTEDVASIMMKRGTKPSPNKDGVVFTRDIRLRTIEYFNIISHEAARSFASRISCEMLILRCKKCAPRYLSMFPEEQNECIEIYKKNCKKCIVEEVDGNHFVHLNDPQRISPIISTFLNT